MSQTTMWILIPHIVMKLQALKDLVTICVGASQRSIFRWTVSPWVSPGRFWVLRCGTSRRQRAADPRGHHLSHFLPRIQDEGVPNASLTQPDVSVREVPPHVLEVADRTPVVRGSIIENELKQNQAELGGSDGSGEAILAQTVGFLPCPGTSGW